MARQGLQGARATAQQDVDTIGAVGFRGYWPVGSRGDGAGRVPGLLANRTPGPAGCRGCRPV